MEYLDLSPYGYKEFPIPMLSIGWLGPRVGVQNVSMPPMATVDIEKLESASLRLGSLMLGVHECEFCPEGSAFEGNGEYRYYAASGKVYSAPMMVLHYVKEHGYTPPQEFLEVLKEGRRLEWDWRADHLAKILSDKSEKFEFRCEAIIDLANWRDVRTLDSLKSAAIDEELVDVAGDEIGRSIGLLLSCEFASEIRVSKLPSIVRFGIEQIRQ